MAARRQLFHPDEVKQKIKTSQLINRLQENALSKKETLTRGQIDSIKTLLAKTVPDLKAIEHTGKDGGPVAVTFSWLPPQS
jgi:flagellar biosynthesis/type III secretory pathway M-ring protein FliF/YscJ